MPKITQILVTGANAAEALKGLETITAAAMSMNPLLAIVGAVEVIEAEAAEAKVLKTAYKNTRIGRR